MKLSINKNKLYLYFILLLTLTFILFYFWFRFFRGRIPREIPFNLSFITFIILVSICFFHIYFLYRLFKPRVSTNDFFIKYLLIILHKIYKPFIILDDTIKNNPYVNKIAVNLAHNFIIYFKLYNIKPMYKLDKIFNLIPKILLLLLFITDVFYFHKINNFYYFIILGIIPLIYNYIIFSITKYIENTLLYLELRYNIILLSTKEDEDSTDTGFMVSLYDIKTNDLGSLNLRYFVEIQAWNYVYEYENTYKYTCIETSFAREEFTRINNIELPPLWVYEPQSDDVSKGLNKTFSKLVPSLIHLYAFSDIFKDHVKPKALAQLKYIIIGYLICWIYILIVSFHTLDIKTIVQIMNTIQDNTNPFSHLNMNEIFNNESKHN